MADGWIIRVFILFSVISLVISRKHQLELNNDSRKYIPLSTFGFYEKGSLEVTLKSFRFQPHDTSKVFGFSLYKTINDAISPYLESRQDRCVLDELRDDDSMAVILFTFDLVHNRLKINCSQHLQTIVITQNRTLGTLSRGPSRRLLRQERDITSDTYLLKSRSGRSLRQQQQPDDLPEPPTPKNDSRVVQTEPPKTIKPNQDSGGSVSEPHSSLTDDHCSNIHIPITPTKLPDGETSYSTKFVVSIEEDSEGLYNLYFHNCPNYQYLMRTTTSVNLTLEIIEENDGNYLSAGEMPLPALYFTMAILFFLSGCFWCFILSKSNAPDVFKTHYLMAMLVYVKSFSLLFHGINFHFIQTAGIHVESWAVLYYIAHLLKGALLFITIVLIGTGLAFVKHILSDKDKKIFMIVIPLQVLANVAEIIIEESEEGESQHTTWKEVFMLVDLLCCGAILFPVVWSIRHLQEASQTDGKAHQNLRKLKLFRHFYIMIVCYIYFTRIIVYLLKITVPFQYEWLDEMFREMATYVFFVMTGYKFRPTGNNPYFLLSLDGDEEEEIECDEIVTNCGVTEGISKVNRHHKATTKEQPPPDDKGGIRRESSLEYD